MTADLIRSVTVTGPALRLRALKDAGYDEIAVQVTPGHETMVADWARVFRHGVSGKVCATSDPQALCASDFGYTVAQEFRSSPRRRGPRVNGDAVGLDPRFRGKGRDFRIPYPHPQSASSAGPDYVWPATILPIGSHPLI